MTDNLEQQKPKRRGRRSNAEREAAKLVVNQETKPEPSVVSVSSDVDVPVLGVYKLFDDVEYPVYATEGSACFDIRAYLQVGYEVSGYSSNNAPIKRRVSMLSHAAYRNVQGILINAFERLMIPTGLIFDVPKGYSLRVYNRSSVGYKLGLFLPNSVGVIDYDYVDQTYILLANMTNSRQVITHQSRVLQAELVPTIDTKIQILDEAPSRKTDRSGGIGHTGT